MAAVFAMVAMIMAIARYVKVMPAEGYEDKGVMEFVAAEWYTRTENVRRQGSAPSHTRYNYYVRYAAVDSHGASYSYHERESSYEKAKAAADSKERIERRVLSDGGNYTTIPAELTKSQWLNKTRMGCLMIFLCCAVYIAGFIVFIIRRRIGE